MIIRSQDKKTITTDLNLNIYQDDWEENRFDISNEAVGVIGTYSTEEKAIKVLDMICTEHVNALSVKQGEVIMNVLDYPKMFIMPQDEEVEV